MSMVFLSAPAGGGFMMGPLDKPLKEARPRQRRNKPNDVSGMSAIDTTINRPTAPCCALSGRCLAGHFKESGESEPFSFSFGVFVLFSPQLPYQYL